jgi:hypothetical protein
MPQLRTMALALVLAISCGSERKANEPATTSPLEVHPPTATVAPKGSQQFSLVPSTVQVAWSVSETGGGSITQAGMYTAPGLSGVFHVVATSTASPAVSAQAVVTVESGVAVSAVSPVNEVACQPVQLSATVTGTSDTQVLWSAPSSCGTITAAGVFTSGRGTGTCVITAQAHADLAKLASITVNVASERVLSVAVAPPTATLIPNGALALAANVTTSCGTFPAGQ